MNRKSFLASVAVLLSAPILVKAKSKDQRNFIGQPISVPKVLPKNPLKAEGILSLFDGYISISSFNNIACVGDIIITDKTEKFVVYEKGHFAVDTVDQKGYTSYWIHCKPVSAPKQICKRPVIMIDNKYVQWKPGRKTWQIKFMPVAMAFREA